MKATRITALNISLVIGLLASQSAYAQTANGPAPAQINPVQTSAPVAAPAPVDAPGQPQTVQPVAPSAPPPAGTTAPAYPPPTATALSGQPYVMVDPATGQVIPLTAYGPMLRPRPAELPYNEGSPIPRGYALQEYHPRGLIIAGAVTLGVLYTISLVVATGNDDTGNGWLAVPVVGPFGWLATHKSSNCGNASYPCTSSSDSNDNATMILDGLGQVAGAAMLVAGLAITRKHLVLVDQQGIMVAPYASSTGSGLRLLGRF